MSRIKQLVEEGFTLDESRGMASYEKALNVMQAMFNERVVEKSFELNVKALITTDAPIKGIYAGERGKSKARLYLVK